MQFDPVQDYAEWYRTHRLIRGADGEGEEETEASATGGEEEGSGEGEGESTESEGSGEGEGGEGEEDDGDQNELDRIRRERDQARDRLTAAEAAARKAKQEAKEAREAAAKKDGNWEQIAAERMAELEDANERAQKAETEAYEAKSELDNFKREVRVTRLAGKIGFRDTDDAWLKFKDKPESTGDDKTCERALRKLAEEKPYLIDHKRARGRAMSGTANGQLLTVEQMKDMTPDQINAAWEKGLIQASLGNASG